MRAGKYQKPYAKLDLSDHSSFNHIGEGKIKTYLEDQGALKLYFRGVLN